MARMFRRTRHVGQHSGEFSPAPPGAPPWAAAEAARRAGSDPAAPPLGEGLAGTPDPVATPSAGRLSRRGWLVVVFAVAAVPSAAGCGLFGTLVLGMDTEGYAVLLTAPVGGFVAGLAAGLLVAWRRLAGPGWVTALSGLAVGVTIGFLSWGLVGTSLFEGGWWYWLAFLAAITGVPGLVGLGAAGLPFVANLMRYWS